MNTDDRPSEDGFEYQGVFYRWAVSTGAKDLMLIDRFTGMPIDDFFEAVDDGFERGRAPMLFALIATSIRAKNPDWSVERIHRLVQAIELPDVEFVTADTEESELPPPSGGQPGPPNSEPSTSPSDESRLSATQAAPSGSETSAVTPR